MSSRQFGFLVGFLVIWLLWAASFWVTVAAVVAGLIGYFVARALEGEVDLAELADRLGGRRAGNR
jgi:hypothetical protein